MIDRVDYSFHVIYEYEPAANGLSPSLLSVPPLALALNLVSQLNRNPALFHLSSFVFESRDREKTSSFRFASLGRGTIERADFLRERPRPDACPSIDFQMLHSRHAHTCAFYDPSRKMHAGYLLDAKLTG